MGVIQDGRKIRLTTFDGVELVLRMWPLDCLLLGVMLMRHMFFTAREVFEQSGLLKYLLEDFDQPVQIPNVSYWKRLLEIFISSIPFCSLGIFIGSRCRSHQGFRMVRETQR